MMLFCRLKDDSKYQMKFSTVNQARRQVSRFGGAYILGGDDFCFYYMFKTTFSGRNKIWGDTKEIWG